jgi:hypothetical protein
MAGPAGKETAQPMESTVDEVVTFTREHTEHIAMIKNHVVFEKGSMSLVHPFASKKKVNFNHRRPYVE